jgi:trans-aconitate methyltransferase
MTEAFWTIHEGLPRQGPGTAEDVVWAVAQIGLPEDAAICDAGAGPGADIPALLAAAPKGHVTAVETHADFVEEIATRHGCDRVDARQSDMSEITGPYDLIWSAGAVYFLGVTEALTAWRPALAPGGAVAFSHICRFADLPDSARAFWDEAYPDLTDEDGICAQIGAAGFTTLATRRLSAEAWAAYHGPLQARIDALRAKADAALTDALDEEQAEIDLYRSTGETWGYLLCVVRPT